MIASAPSGDPRALPPLPVGWHPARYSVLADGTMAVLATDLDLTRAWAEFHAAMRRWPHHVTARTRPHALAERASAQMFVLEGASWTAGASFTLETPFPLFDRMPDGRWLVASAWTDHGAPNARTIAPDGSVQRRFTLGDGIEHVAIDDAARIWVGWFDEGVFGNDAWRIAGREWPPSANGVACFGSDGAVFPDMAWPDGVESAADCYALNACGQGVWICPYTDFPLVRFEPEKPTRWWTTDLAGPRAIAAANGVMLAAGGYAAQADRLALLVLPGRGSGEAALARGRWTLPLRRREPEIEGHVWRSPDLLTGRGDTIHLVDDGIWRRWRVGEMRAAARRA